MFVRCQKTNPQWQRICRQILMIITLSCSLYISSAAAQDAKLPDIVNLPKEQKYQYTNYAVAAGVLTYGIIKWDYFQNRLETHNENWFSRNTDSGGADKLGHLYTSYLTAQLANELYLDWGFDAGEAAKNSVITSFILSTAMELGDASSPKYGFSYEDFISNSVGQILSYYMSTNKRFASLVDLRLEYYPKNGVGSDIVTDYESMKYIVALKLAGFDELKDTPLRFLELQIGYYTRHYEDNPSRINHERSLYFGVGVNVAQILNELDYKKTARVFNYLQVPYTYVEAVKVGD